jgi:hypothetical protein
MIDVIFDWCVELLVKLAELLGITYNDINVWIFVIFEPLIFLLMLFIIIKQLIKIKRLKKKSG